MSGLEWVLAESESAKVAQKWLWLLLVAHGRRILTAIMRSAVRRTEGAAEKSNTNIFDAAKFDLCDTSTLKILENYVKSGKIKVVLSDIVVRESKRHIADQVKKICGIMRKARATALEGATEHLINTIGLG